MSRGDRWVVAQFVIFALIGVSLFFGPGVTSFGWVLAAAGLALAVWAGVTLGPSLSPFPRPPRHAELVQRGPFRYLRHPLYVGGALFFAGLSLVFSVYALALTGVLAGFWIAKARLEERHLAARFPEYEAYRRRTWF
ncbi:MAG TPA: methyltransferase [Gaiellaceae bacterium]|jgi:protein-S-isoprenylcysteine O-methyltransferase Ste14|nr:methyltransferase [Gaiellaceae bacterium]